MKLLKGDDLMGILEGRTAIVVGASSGVGYGCALRYIEEGANVLACAIDEEGLLKLEKEATEKGLNGKVKILVCDVAKEEDLDNIVETTVKEFGTVEILACIAQGGLSSHTHLLETTSEICLESYKTGPLYTMLLMQKCFPYMKEQGYGRIITTASGAAISGTTGFTGYSMAKGAIMSLTRVAAKEWAKYGITVNCFLPVIKTDAFNNTEQGKAAMEQLKKVIPVGFVGDSYKDSSPILAFIASEQAGYYNAQMVGIDGGLNLLA